VQPAGAPGDGRELQEQLVELALDPGGKFSRRPLGTDLGFNLGQHPRQVGVLVAVACRLQGGAHPARAAAPTRNGTFTTPVERPVCITSKRAASSR